MSATSRSGMFWSSRGHRSVDDEEGYRHEFIRLVRETRAQGLLKR